jgi:hypothetical protein
MSFGEMSFGEKLFREKSFVPFWGKSHSGKSRLGNCRGTICYYGWQRSVHNFLPEHEILHLGRYMGTNPMDFYFIILI